MPTILTTWKVENHGSRPVWANCLQNPISKITRAKMDCRCGSEFKPQSHQKKRTSMAKKRNKTNKKPRLKKGKRHKYTFLQRR
jgi:hypothetical protein